jgi:hypothetical protein
VRLDPRSHATINDLQMRLALEQQIVATIDSLDRAIAAAIATRGKVATSANGEIQQLMATENDSSEADTMHGTRVREQLGFLLNSLEGSYAKPTAAEYDTYRDLSALATAGEARLKGMSAH